MDAESVIEQLQKLSPEEKLKVREYLDTTLTNGVSEREGKALLRRKAGLHPGAMEMTPDFDAPLPDDFWLGKE